MNRPAPKSRIRKAARRVRTESSLSTPRVLATALAAITMAIVSSQLTTVVNSVLLVGLVSIGSALTGEFYRILLDISARKTKQVVEPVLPSSSGEQVSSQADVVSGQVSVATSKAVEQNQAVAVEDPHPHTSSFPQSEQTNRAGSDDTFVAAHAQPAPKEASERSVWNRLIHSQTVQMSIIFAIVALLTVGISYAVAKSQGGNQYTTYQTRVEQSLSASDRQAIADEAAEAAKQQVDKDVANQSAPSTPAPTPDTSGSQSSIGAEEAQSLLQEVQQLKSDNQTLQGSVDELKSVLADEQTKTDDLSARLDALQEQLDSLNPTPSTDTPTP